MAPPMKPLPPVTTATRRMGAPSSIEFCGEPGEHAIDVGADSTPCHFGHVLRNIDLDRVLHLRTAVSGPHCKRGVEALHRGRLPGNEPVREGPLHIVPLGDPIEYGITTREIDLPVPIGLHLDCLDVRLPGRDTCE